MTDTQVIDSPQVGDPELDNEEPTEAHIIAREDNADAETIVMESFVEGTPVTALCGKVFVPSRTPNLPICERCSDALKDILAMRGSL